MDKQANQPAFPKIRYAPRESANKFCAETGKPKPPMTTHWLEWDNDGYWSHLGILSDVPGFNVAKLGRAIEALPDLIEALKSIENDDGRIPATIWQMRNEAIAKAEGTL